MPLIGLKSEKYKLPSSKIQPSILKKSLALARSNKFSASFRIFSIILKENLKPGQGQGFEDHEDLFHPKQKVGKGVYCSPDPRVMDEYAGRMEIEGVYYKIGFMLRVNPEKIRCPKDKRNYWVLNGTSDEIRPYRILIKQI